MIHLTAEALPAFLLQHPAAVLLDVRPPHEHRGGVPPRSRHVPWHTPGRHPDTDFLAQARAVLDPLVPVLVLCQRGLDSPVAAALLEAAGFRRVYNLLGGWDDLHPARPGAFVAGIDPSFL